MLDHHLDFRSDTAVWPSSAMRAAMAEADLGDAVFREDPTVNRLQEHVARMLGKEAALFVPSGTMSNQIGLRLHCRPGDEMICEADCHIYHYEQGGYAQLSGIAVRAVAGVDHVLQVDQLRDLIRPDDAHFVRTRLLCLENTHNRGGGKILPHGSVTAACAWAHEQGLATHLDGARLFNAVVATGIEAARWAEPFDTVSVCFSKGLGAPVGSALAGPRALIDEGFRHAKVLGGGMRQAGVIAAAAQYALDHNIPRLAEDHANARRLARGIQEIDGLDAAPERCDTNLVFFHVDSRHGTAEQFAARLRRKGLLMLATSRTTIRASLHLDIRTADVQRALDILHSVTASA